MFEGGDNKLLGLRAKKQLNARLDIKTSGHAIYKRNTYGSYLGRGVANAREAGELIRQLRDEGVDYIKLVHSGIFEPATGRITSGGFEKQELRSIAAEARSSGLEIMCHANGEQAIREAVDAGVSSIIHGLRVSNETLLVMAERGTSLIPTVNAFASLKKTCRKLGVSFWHYLNDRVSGSHTIPPLPEIIRQRAEEAYS